MTEEPALKEIVAPNISKLVKNLCKTREKETGGFQGLAVQAAQLSQ